MSEPCDVGPTDVTSVEDAIHDQVDARRFIRVTPVAGRRNATVDGDVIADSTAVLVCEEVGFDIDDPVVSFRRAEVAAGSLVAVETTTHRPFEGAPSTSTSSCAVSAAAMPRRRTSSSSPTTSCGGSSRSIPRRCRTAGRRGRRRAACIRCTTGSAPGSRPRSSEGCDSWHGRRSSASSASSACR